jgi:flagellar biogenesis protein FliO
MPSILIHQLLQFVLAFIGAIVLLYMIVVYYRQRLTGQSGQAFNPDNKIVIEGIQFLEPRKNLYVVRTGQQRFLISTTDQQAQLISTLPELSQTDYQAWVETEQNKTQQLTSVPDSISGRLATSFKMVMNQYFGTRS